MIDGPKPDPRGLALGAYAVIFVLKLAVYPTSIRPASPWLRPAWTPMAWLTRRRPYNWRFAQGDCMTTVLGRCND